MTDMKTPCAVEFTKEFIMTVGNTLAMYDKALDQVQGLVNGDGFIDEYGMCNKKYRMLYITPKDVASYIDYLFTAISRNLIDASIPDDLEKFSVSMAKRFMQDNKGCQCGTDKRGNIFALSSYADPRVETMMDLLVQTENTFFDRHVFSKFEMIERARNMKSDYETMNAMHLKPALSALIKSLPKVITDHLKDTRLMSGFSMALVTTYIETFIMFVASLNYATLCQMIGYAQPMSTFLRKDKHPETVTQESVDVEKYSPMFIMLTSGKSPLVSNTIKKITKSNWSHASISFDPTLKTVYSYALAKTEFAPKSQGLRQESISAENMKDCEISVFCTYVPNNMATDMLKLIEERIQGKTKFDIGLLLKRAFNGDISESIKSYKKICTTFVNDLIEEVTKKKYADVNVPSPQQIYDAGKIHEHEVINVYEGIASGYEPTKTASMLAEHTKNKETKPFVEYVTECCFINTNDVQLRMRVPFDINIRNIVLQDQTDGFRETRTALKFMIRDNRSPIRGLLLKYTTKRNLNDRVECEPVMNLFKPYFDPDNWSASRHEYNRMSFHTDLNWLGRIAYNNQFSDGDYRMDTPGNDKRSPILQTLSTLERMYCGCNLKTNEELANHICTLSLLIDYVLNQPNECVVNRDLVRDIVAVLGECFTKCVIKLFNNNANAIIYSDDMKDTMAPGFAYCEQFVYMEEDTNAGSNNANNNGNNKSGLSFGTNTQTKTFGLNNIKSLLRQFANWIVNVLRNVPKLFWKINEHRATYVKNHDSLNKEIAAALSQPNPFVVNCTQVPLYNIPLKELTSEIGHWKANVDEYLQAGKAAHSADGKNDANIEKKFNELKLVFFPGAEKQISASILEKSGEERKKAVENFVLFSKTDVRPDDSSCYYSGKMNEKLWTDICEDLKHADDLIAAFSNGTYGEMKKCVDAVNKAIPSDNSTPKYVSDLATFLTREVQKEYIIVAINAFTKKLFDTYYKYYKETIDNYQSQYKKNHQENPENNETKTDEAPKDQSKAPEAKQDDASANLNNYKKDTV